MCACYYLRLILGANYLLLHERTFYKQRPKTHKGVGSVLASFFVKDVSLCFSKIWLLLRSQTKPFGKLIRFSQLFRFLMHLEFNTALAHRGKFTNMCLLSSVTRGLLLEQVQRGLLTFSTVVFEEMLVRQLQLYTVFYECNFLERTLSIISFSGKCRRWQK